MALFLPVISNQTHAAAPITPSGLNTQVSQPVTLPSGQTQYNITGGTRPGGGTNLFHSFGDFSVPTNNIANFLNDSGLATSNILGRVTGGNPSSIFGMIQTNGTGGFGNANLFLMNPAGFLFGPNATLNVGGMVAFTTADYIRLNDNARFNAVAGPPDLLLTAAPVAAFGFLGNNPAAIAIQGSTLTVAQGQSLSLVGGNKGFTATDPDNGNPINVPDGITMTGGKLSALGGQINIVSVAGPGEISAVDFMPTTGMTMGNINLSQGALLDVSDDAAGTVRIRGGQLVMDDATISADTGNTNGASTAIAINVTADLSIADSRGLPALTARTTGDGDAGAIRINSANLTAGSTSTEIFALIDTHTSGAGRAGDIQITTGNLEASYQGGGIIQLTDSGTAGPGHGGDVIISANSVTIEGMGINTGDSMAAIVGQTASGSAGNVTITADQIHFLNSTIDTSALQSFDSSEQAGAVTLTAHDINMTSSIVSALGFGGGGAFTFTADNFIVRDGSQIESLTAAGPGGGVRVNANVVELLNGSTIATTTVGDGQAGDIGITATDHFTIVTTFFDSRPSGLFSNSTGDLGSGNAGTIVVTTPTLNMTGGSRINTATLSSGRGGDVTINASNAISISGEFPSSDPEPIFGIGTIHPSGIFTKTAGSDLCVGPCGDAGHISITTGTLSLGAGAQIDSGTSNTGRGGDITIQATNMISMSGTLADGSAVGIFSRTIGTDPGSGNGGNIQLHANQFQVANGAQISASTLGPGNAGNVILQGTASPAQSVLIDGFGSGVFTDTQGAGAGGNIFVNANSVTLQNGGMLSATTSGSGNAGNISVLGDQVSLTNFSAITTSTSGQGAGGTIDVSAGNSINVVESFISASSNANPDQPNAGNGGQITLHAPTIDLAGGTISTLTLGPGNAGDIQIQADTFKVRASENFFFGLVEASTSGAGRGGNISVLGLEGPGSRDTDVSLSGLGSLRSDSQTSNGGTAGNISVETVRLSLTEGSAITTASLNQSPGNAGNVTLNATESILVSGGFITSDVLQGSTGHGGQIAITTPTLTVNQGSDGFGGLIPGLISTSTSSSGNAGSVTINANSVALTDGGRITSNSFSEAPFFPAPTGAAGSVVVQGFTGPGTSANSIIISGRDGFGSASGIFTDTQGTGAGGNISINANSVMLQNAGTVSAQTSGTDGSATGGKVTVNGNQVQLTSGATITTATSGPGNAGDITVKADTFSMNDGATITASSTGSGNAGSVTIEGLASPAQSVLIDGAGSGIFTDTHSIGAGGNILVNANAVTLQNGGTLSAVTSGTETTATGGTITVNANQVQLNSGALITASTTGVGTGGSITIDTGSTFASNAGTVTSSATQATGGDINISAGQSVTIDNGSLITASSNGAGNAGNIVINAGQQYTSTNSSVTTKAEQASGGNITVLATGLVHLTNSEINASVEGSSTTVGGNILIDPVYVILENSQILAEANQGQGGNINIFYTGALLTSSSRISATSQFGQSGTVTIQSPISPASGKIIPLSQKPLIETSLMSQRCAALAGGNFSSFTLAGRDTLPAEPGGWLSSPLALGTLSEERGLEARSERETPLLSLRQIAPPGFLTQAFAVESSGCQS